MSSPTPPSRASVERANALIEEWLRESERIRQDHAGKIRCAVEEDKALVALLARALDEASPEGAVIWPAAPSAPAVGVVVEARGSEPFVIAPSAPVAEVEMTGREIIMAWREAQGWPGLTGTHNWAAAWADLYDIAVPRDNATGGWRLRSIRSSRRRPPRPRWGGDVMEAEPPHCTAICWAMPICETCGRRKKPRGRDAAPMTDLCDPDCRGYDEQPISGHLWPDEEAS